MKSAFSKFHLDEIRETVLLLLYESAFRESAFRESAFRESALSRKCTLAEAPFAKLHSPVTLATQGSEEHKFGTQSVRAQV